MVARRYNDIVTADLHIDIANRPKDVVRVLREMLEFAVKKKAQRMVVCGDVYERRLPHPEEQKIFQRWVVACVREGMEVLIVVGNHDTISSRLKGGLYHTLGEFDNLQVKGVTVSERGVEEGVVYFGHHLVVGATMSNNVVLSYGIPAIELANQHPACSLFILGDVHKHQHWDVGVGGKRKRFVYVGSPERNDFGERENTPGFVWLQGTSDRPEWHFVETHPRPMVQIEVSISDCGKVGKIAQYPKDSVLKVIAKGSRVAIDATSLKVLEDLFTDAYSVAIEYEVLSEERIRNEKISERQSPVQCFLEYAKVNKLSKKVVELGMELIRRVG